MKLEGEDLRREIDSTLAELDELEADILELFAEMLGPDAAQRIVEYKRARQRDPDLELLRRAASRGSSTEPRETR